MILKRMFLAVLCVVLLISVVTADTVTNDRMNNMYKILNPIILTDSNGYYALGRHIEYLEDPEQSLTINDMNQKNISSQFITSYSDILNFGFSNSAYWFRFNIVSRSEESKKMNWLIEIAYPRLSNVELYEPLPSGEYKMKSINLNEPITKRAFKTNHYVFQLSINADQAMTYYLRVVSESSIQIPLILWSYEAFIKSNHQTQYIQGMYFGIMIVMVLSNFFLYTAFRDKNYLYYCLFIFTYLISHITLTGKGFELLFGTYPWLRMKVLATLIGVCCIWMILLARSFLNIKSYHIGLYRSLTIIFWVSIGVTIFSIIGPYAISIKICSTYIVFASLTILAAGCVAFKNNDPNSRYFIIAWIPIILGIIIYVLKTFGYLPANFFTEYAMQIGSVILVVLFSFGMAEYFNNERKKHEKLLEDAIIAQKESLKAQDEIASILSKKSAEMVKQAHELIQSTEIVNSKSDMVSTASDEMIIHINTITKTVEEMTASINSISGSTDQMSQYNHGFMNGIEKIKNATHDVGQIAENGRVVSVKAVEMTDLARDTMKGLGQSADEIGGVTEVIKKIAEKTDILAVNAAIEAASAGDAGKGFAVVANEITKFAEQSAKAAQDIAIRISGVQMNTEEAVGVISNLSNVIKEISNSSYTISKALEEQSKLIQEIASNASYANSRSEHIASAMSQLVTVSNEVAMNTSKIANQSDEFVTNIRDLHKASLDCFENIKNVSFSANDLYDLAGKFSTI